MQTNYASNDAFHSTASGPEKDALSLFRRLDELTPTEVIESEDELRDGAGICANLNAGWAGQTAEDLEAEYLGEIDSALNWARDPATWEGAHISDVPEGLEWAGRYPQIDAEGDIIGIYEADAGDDEYLLCDWRDGKPVVSETGSDAVIHRSDL